MVGEVELGFVRFLRVALLPVQICALIQSHALLWRISAQVCITA